MPRCPNCSYKLVLLSSRPKYKCALCSRLFPQQKIDNKEFKEWNKIQKEIDLQNLDIEFKKEWKNLQELKQGIKQLFNGIPKRLRDKESIKNWFKEYYEKNKAKILARNEVWRLKNIEYDDNRKKEYYDKNREKILQKNKLMRQENLQEYNQKRKEWRTKNIETNRIHYIIRTYRRKQKALALLYLKNNQQEVSNLNIFSSVPTYPLSYLLTHSR